MPTWRDTILQHFVPHVNRLTLVADPDDLLTEELLAIELRQRGFDIIDFTDPVAFRYVYERQYRSAWDRGENTPLMMIARVPRTALDTLPYDLLSTGRHLHFDLGSIFPNLSYPVLESLDRKHLDAVFTAQHIYTPGPLGDSASKDFLLHHVFGIAANLINTAADLLRSLLQYHYKRQELPHLLSERFIRVLRRKPHFSEWPLERIVNDSNAFFQFLQERWPIYLNTLHAPLPLREGGFPAETGFPVETIGGRENRRLKEQSTSYSLNYPGPALLPFDHQDVCAYIDTLFLEERLTPIELPEGPAELPAWAKTGVIVDRRKSQQLRASRLRTKLKESFPEPDARYSDWLTFAMQWAEFSAILQGPDADMPNDDSAEDLWTAIDTRFNAWLRQHYAGLVNLPPVTPAMVHHIPRYLLRDVEAHYSERLALIVVDGLSLAQWVTLRAMLAQRDSELVIRESASFAWIPTLTSVSRQAIFAGKAPLYFAAGIGTTAKEAALWRQFWEDAGISRSAIAYQKGLGDGNPADVLERVFHPGQTRILGLVVDKVDKIMHGMQLGTAGMHNQIRQWAQGGFLASCIRYLLDSGYHVWLTSDHGNLECTGQGRLTDGVLAETRGERVRIYSAPELINNQKGQAWQPIGLPDEYYPLIAENRSAFVTSGATTVAHGGTSIEEVIVPVVKFERRTT